MSARLRDFISAVFFFLLAAYIYFASLSLRQEGPEKMPQLIAAILAVSAVLLFVKTLRGEDDRSRIFEGVNWSALSTLVIAWMAAILLIGGVGFFALLGIFMAVVNWNMSGRSREARGLAKVAAYAAVTTGVLWLIFVKILYVNPPAGILF